MQAHSSGFASPLHKKNVSFKLGESRSALSPSSASDPAQCNLHISSSYLASFSPPPPSPRAGAGSSPSSDEVLARSLISSLTQHLQQLSLSPKHLAAATDLCIYLEEFEDASAACMVLQGLARIFGGGDGAGQEGGSTTLQSLESIAYALGPKAKEDRDAATTPREGEEVSFCVKRLCILASFPLSAQTGGHLSLLLAALPKLDSLDVTVANCFASYRS